MSIDQALQAWLSVTSLVAIALTQSARQGVRLWAPVLGLASQPAWLWVTFQADQWGMFAASAAFTAVWAWGLCHSINRWRWYLAQKSVDPTAAPTTNGVFSRAPKRLSKPGD